MNPRVVAAIARKDIVDAIRNRYLLVALLTPLFVAVLLRVLLPGSSTLIIVVHDPGNSRLVSELRASPRINFVNAGSAEGVSNEVEKSKAVGGLVIPTNFDADVAAGKQPELAIYINNKKSSIEQAMFRQLMDQQVRSLVQHPAPARLIWINVTKEARAQTGNFNQMMLPLLLLMTFVMSGALVVPLLLVEEKEKRTLDFLLTSPANLTEIIAGKAATGIAYSLLITGFLLAINYKLVSNWPLTLLTVFLGLLFIVAVGLFMGSLFQNTMQVNTWAGLVLFLLLAPSFPAIPLPAILEAGLHLIPTHHFVEASKLSLSGSPSAWIWGHLAVLSVCTVLAFGAAIWGLRRQQT